MHTCEVIFLCVCAFIIDLCRHIGPDCVVIMICVDTGPDCVVIMIYVDTVAQIV
jgi:hypothetical protein